MICGKNQDVRVEVCVSTTAEYLYRKGGHKVFLNCAIEAANQIIDKNFDFSKSEDAVKCVAVYPTRVFPAVMHFYLTYIESKMKQLIQKHRTDGILSTADLEQLSIWERLCQFMFSGSPKKLPTLLLKELGCLTSLSERSIPYFYPHLLDMVTLKLDLAKTWNLNQSNIRLYHLAMLERQYGTTFYEMQKAMLELQYYLDGIKESSSTEDKFLRLATNLFSHNIFLPEFFQELLNFTDSSIKTMNASQNIQGSQNIQELKQKIEKAIRTKQYALSLDSEQQGFFLPLNRGNQSFDEFSKNMIEIFLGLEKGHKNISKKEMFFPRALSLILASIKTTERFSLQDFISQFAQSLRLARVPFLPFYSMKRYKFGLVQVNSTTELHNTFAEGQARATQFWENLLPSNSINFSFEIIPNFENIVDNLCQKFEFIDKTIFDLFHPSTDLHDAEAFIKCGLLSYRMFVKKNNGFEVEENTEGSVSWTTKTVYSLLLYIAIKYSFQAIIDIFKDKPKTKNLAHHKVLCLIIFRSMCPYWYILIYAWRLQEAMVLFLLK